MSINNESQLDLKAFFPYQFSVLAQQMSEFISQIYKKYGLSKTQWRVLATVGQHNEITAREVCEFTHLDKMQVSRAISKLIENNILSQHSSEIDRRSNHLKLTDNGQAMYQEIIPLVLLQEQRLFTQLTSEEQEQLKTLTLKLSARLAES